MQNKPPERLGEPSTYVYASELSAEAILQGIALGWVCVSMGARLYFGDFASALLVESA